jgi:hypothetical protein
MTLVVGPQAVSLIVLEEVSSEAYYTAKCQHPYWPGGASGITVGIGYDLGQHSPAEITADWRNFVTPLEVAGLVKSAGLKGTDALHALKAGLFITVPFVVAQTQFSSITLPHYAQMTDDAIDNCGKLPPDAFGALVSITFNRGVGGWNNGDSDRFSEMYQVGSAMSDGAFEQIPNLIRAMKRHWPVDSGLWNRRLKEADLFEHALKGTWNMSGLQTSQQPPISTSNVLAHPGSTMAGVATGLLTLGNAFQTGGIPTTTVGWMQLLMGLGFSVMAALGK